MNSVFMTFNPKSIEEESTALRLQTISHLYGMTVELPMRTKTNSVSFETHKRIKRANWIVTFPFQNLSPIVRKELNEAIKLGKPVIVVYDEKIGKTINFGKYKNVKELTFDFDQKSTDSVLHDVADFMRTNEPKTEEKPSIPLGVALIGIGLSLLALFAIAEDG